MGKQVNYDYDSNFRKTMARQAPGTSDEATSWFTYDEIGNLKTQQDPKGNVTTLAYDNRNRHISTTDPAPFKREEQEEQGRARVKSKFLDRTVWEKGKLRHGSSVTPGI